MFPQRLKQGYCWLQKDKKSETCASSIHSSIHGPCSFCLSRQLVLQVLSQETKPAGVYKIQHLRGEMCQCQKVRKSDEKKHNINSTAGRPFSQQRSLEATFICHSSFLLSTEVDFCWVSDLSSLKWIPDLSRIPFGGYCDLTSPFFFIHLLPFSLHCWLFW